MGIGETEYPELAPAVALGFLSDRIGSNAGALLDSVDVVARAVLVNVGEDDRDVEEDVLFAGGVVFDFNDDRR